HGPNLLADVERCESTAIEGVQVPVLLDLLAAELLNREHPKPTALMVRRGQADDSVPEIVEARLPTALEAVEDVLLAAFHETFLEGGDEARRRAAVVFRQRVDRIDQHDASRRDANIDE